MSECKPPSQNSPRAPPRRARTPMLPAARCQPNGAPQAARIDGPRNNDEHHKHEIQVVDQTGLNHGNVETNDAIKMAMEAGRDLVEISADNNPPVCKIMDYGKFKYSAQKKA